MCEANAFIIRDGNEEKLLESVDIVEVEGDNIQLTSIFGEQKSLRAKLRSYDNSSGKIIFEPMQ